MIVKPYVLRLSIDAATLRRAATCVLAVLGVVSVCLGQEPSIVSQVDREAAYIGDQIVYSVQVNNAGESSEPDLGDIDFKVESLGSSQSSRMTSFQDGNRIRRSVQHSVIFQYRFSPTMAGTFTLPAPTVTVDGVEVSGKPITITVIGPEEQHYVILEASVDKQTVYPLQPFTVSLTVAVRQPQGPYASRSPLSIQPQQPVQLTVPWLSDEQISAALRPGETISDILQPIVNRPIRRSVDGMHINDVSVESGDAFSFFSNRQRGVFLPKSTRTTRSTADEADAEFVEYKLQRSFSSQRIGEYVFSPSRMKGVFGTELVDGNVKAQQIFAVSNSLTVKVKNVPSQGRPDSYVGAIGAFRVNADLLPATASVGEPMTLTLSIFGEGTVADIRAPDINVVPGIADSFRTYDATEKTEANGRVFTYSLRALSEEVTEFPSLPVAYFDVNKEEYVSLATPAIPLTITAAQELATSDIVAGLPAVGGADQLRTSDAGLFANHSSLQTLRATNFSMSRWMTIWIAMIVGYFSLSFGLQRRQRLHADPDLVKRRNARGRAIESLKAVRVAAGSDDSVSLEALSRIVATLISDYTGAAEAGMTSVDATAALSRFEIDSVLRERVTAFMEQGDAARFGAGGTDVKLVTEECDSLITDLSRELEKRC